MSVNYTDKHLFKGLLKIILFAICGLSLQFYQQTFHIELGFLLYRLR